MKKVRGFFDVYTVRDSTYNDGRGFFDVFEVWYVVTFPFNFPLLPEKKTPPPSTAGCGVHSMRADCRRQAREGGGGLRFFFVCLCDWIEEEEAGLFGIKNARGQCKLTRWRPAHGLSARARRVPSPPCEAIAGTIALHIQNSFPHDIPPQGFRLQRVTNA
jgi:hypothetical protein